MKNPNVKYKIRKEKKNKTKRENIAPVV